MELCIYIVSRSFLFCLVSLRVAPHQHPPPPVIAFVKDAHHYQGAGDLPIHLELENINKCYCETDELPNPRPTQPNKIRLKVAFGPLFPTTNQFSWVGIDFIQETGYKKPNPTKFSTPYSQPPTQRRPSEVCVCGCPQNVVMLLPSPVEVLDEDACELTYRTYAGQSEYGSMYLFIIRLSLFFPPPPHFTLYTSPKPALTYGRFCL